MTINWPKVVILDTSKIVEKFRKDIDAIIEDGMEERIVKRKTFTDDDWKELSEGTYTIKIFEYLTDRETAPGSLREYAREIGDIFDSRDQEIDGAMIEAVITNFGNKLFHLMCEFGMYDEKGICHYDFYKYLNFDAVLVKTTKPIEVVN